MIPRATYRLQFHRGFPFEAAFPLAPYFERLGISHVYSSPILKARPGSMHGYDLVDHSVINPELGGEEGFRKLARELRAHGIGLIVDIVPNHMAADEENGWWWDVLKHGRESRFGNFFDIDWDALDGKVLLAVLGKRYREALESAEIKVGLDERGAPCVRYFGRHWPLRPEDRNINANEYQSVERLHALLERQHYRLAWWRTANDTINWRRFFDVPDLIALKQETKEVFDLSHAKIFELYRAGLIDGVRVDHADGLADPGAYCRALRDRLDQLGADRSSPDKHPYIVVEKILGRGEVPPNDWGVDGTTGYDFMNDVSALQHEEAGAEPLSALWHRQSRRPCEFETEEVLARGEIAQSSFESGLERTADAFHNLVQDTKVARDITRPAIRRALLLILQYLRVYRTYATGRPGSPSPAQFDAAVADAKAIAGGADSAALDFIGGSFQGAELDGSPDGSEAIRRFNQLSAPVAAKAVEDTAFYRYGRLLSRNDVGFQPGTLSLSIPEFHRRAQRRAADFPHSLLATATHDHKRGEDVRARLAILSEIPDEWAGAMESWSRANARHRPGSIDPADEYQLYQTLVGAWPFDLRPPDSEGLKIFGERVVRWQEKALREAKLRSSWLDPNLECERDAQAFTRAILDPSCSSPFLRSLCEFVEQIAPAGALNGLVQATLRCTVPGVPDCYQGAEFWDFSLVDPDNRRPVDYDSRIADLQSPVAPERLLADWRGGGIKQAIISALLQIRQRRPTVFAEGSYLPLELHGAQKDHVLAFARIHQEGTIVAAVPLHVAKVCRGLPHPAPNFWNNTVVELPQALRDIHWEHVFDNGYTDAGAQMGCSALFARFPVAVLVGT